jgi:hypothetical protein
MRTLISDAAVNQEAERPAKWSDRGRVVVEVLAASHVHDCGFLDAVGELCGRDLPVGDARVGESAREITARRDAINGPVRAVLTRIALRLKLGAQW